MIQGSVNAAFDSVNLINTVVALSASANNVDTVDRNVGHLQIMLAKSWFSSALTDTQSVSISASIASGTTFIASKP